MSVKTVKNFIEQLQQDETLANKLVGAESFEDRRQLVRDAGYDFSLDELTQGAEQYAEQMASSELSDDQLKAVTGGVSTTTLSSFGFTGSTFNVTTFNSLFTSSKIDTMYVDTW